MEKEIHQHIIRTIHEIETLSFSSLECLSTNIHGIKHLRQVAYLSGRFAHSLNLDYKTAILAGYLHDCARNNDGDGNSHAHESASLAKKIIERNWSNIDIDKIYNAIYFHADGLTTENKFIGCIWDADRLSLIRLGVIPKVELLSTGLAKRIHYRFIENNRIFPQIFKIALNLQKQLEKTGKASIGIWHTENSNIVLQLLLNLLEDSFHFDFTQLTIVSLFEYSNTPKNHDQSCCFQIYKSSSNRINLDQIVCPQHDSNNQEITAINIPCILSYEYPYYPFLNRSILAKNEIKNYPIIMETRNYLSRFYEKSTNTPDSLKTFPTDFYTNIDILIVLIDKSFTTINNKIATIIPESWFVSAFKMNNEMNINICE